MLSTKFHPTRKDTAKKAYPDQFRYKRLWDNIVTYLQISINQSNRYTKYDADKRTFSGRDAVDLILVYIKDLEFVERSFVTAAKEMTRQNAFQLCQRMLNEHIIEPVHDTRDTSGIFQDSKKLYRFPLTDCVNTDLAALFGSLSTSDDPSSGSFGMDGGEKARQSDLRGDIFMELFGTLQPGALSMEDKMSLDSSTSSCSSASSERSFLSYWDVNFAGCMEVWREISLKNLLVMTDIPCLEKILERSKEEDELPLPAPSFLQHFNLPSMVQAAADILDHMPQFSAAMARTDVGGIHPITLVNAVYDQCQTQISTPANSTKSQFGLMLEQLLKGKSQPEGLFPARHAELHAGIDGILLSKGPQFAVAAFQLYNLILPWHRRELLKRLLKFLSLVSEPEVALLRRERKNKDILVEKFLTVVFSKETDLDELMASRLLSFMITNADDIFSIPRALKDEVETRIIFLGNAAAEENLNLTQIYVENSITKESLSSLLASSNYRSMPVREKRQYIKTFKEFHPQAYQHFLDNYTH